MKRKLVTLVVAAAAGSAAAQSSVTLFGVVDLALTRGTASGAGSTSATRMESGELATSRLGFRGTEDLGGGMRASFWLESQLYADEGAAGRAGLSGNQTVTTPARSGLSFTRRSTVSISHDSFGELRFGRDLTPSLYNIAVYDPIGNNGVGTTVTILGPATGLGAGATYALLPAGQSTNGVFARASNMISYFTPNNLGGVFGMASYWLGENPQNGAANEDDGTGYGARIGYRGGPFEIAAAWAKTRFRNTPVSTAAGAPSGDFRDMNFGGKWNVGIATLMAHYTRETRLSTTRADGRGWLFGASIPVGPHEVNVEYNTYRIDAGTGTRPRTNLVALQYVHNLSRRTALYAAVARASNSNGARIALGGASIGPGVGDARSTGIDLGIKHSF